MSSSSSDKSMIPISKETISRLLHDVKNIMRSPLTDNGIYYVHDDEDMLKGYALIMGPSDTPYFGGAFFFEFNYPTDYPHSPPSLKYCTNGDGIRFNPNLYTGGKVCISILNTWRGEQWTSCQTISTVLLTLCTILCKEPLLNEPGVTTTHRDFNNYNKIIEYKNIDVAILKIISRHKSIYPMQFDMFYSVIHEHFIKNSDTIIKYLEKKMEENSKPVHITTDLYTMHVVVDYANLYKIYNTTLKNVLSISAIPSI